MTQLATDETDHSTTAMPAWVAAADAQRRSAAHSQGYDHDTQTIAEACTEYARRVFTRSRIYLTYRTQFFTIKACDVQRADLIDPLFAVFEARIASLAGVRVKTRTGYIYRIPKGLSE